MHITLETDYAIRIIDCIARENKRLDAKTISEITAVPLRFSLKILRKLVTGEIIDSYKGIHGGYEISKDLSEISLYDVVELLEGTYNLSRCLDGEYECTCIEEGELGCTYRAAFGRVSNIVREELKKYTFDKLVKVKPTEEIGV